MNVSKSIVRAVRSQTPAGRFLQKDDATNLYIDIGDRKAVDKTSQALREGAPNLRSKIDSDDEEENEDGSIDCERDIARDGGEKDTAEEKTGEEEEGPKSRNQNHNVTSDRAISCSQSALNAESQAEPQHEDEEDTKAKEDNSKSNGAQAQRDGEANSKSDGAQAQRDDSNNGEASSANIEEEFTKEELEMTRAFLRKKRHLIGPNSNNNNKSKGGDDRVMSNKGALGDAATAAAFMFGRNPANGNDHASVGKGEGRGFGGHRMNSNSPSSFLTEQQKHAAAIAAASASMQIHHSAAAAALGSSVSGPAGYSPRAGAPGYPPYPGFMTRQQQQAAALLGYRTPGNPLHGVSNMNMRYSAHGGGGGGMNMNGPAAFGAGGQGGHLHPSLQALASQQYNNMCNGNDRSSFPPAAKKHCRPGDNGWNDKHHGQGKTPDKRDWNNEEESNNASDTNGAPQRREPKFPPSRGEDRQEKEEEFNSVPERPLCAYDIFLKHELSLAMASRPDMCKSSATAATPSSELEAMTKEIEARWRTASPNVVKKYWELAESDMNRYRCQMVQYHEKEANKWREQVTDWSLLRRWN